MPREKVFFGVLFALLIGGVLAGLVFDDTPRPVDYRLASELPEPRPQAADERHFLDAELVEVLDLDSIERPIGAQLGADGTLLVHDWTTRAVHEISRIGETVAVHQIAIDGDDHPLLQDFALDPGHDRLWLAFQQRSLVATLPRPDGAPERIALPGPAHRVVPTTDGFVVMTGEQGTPIFARYPRDGGEPQRFGQLVGEPARGLMVRDGRIDGDGGSTFFYAPRYFSLLLSYAADGNLRWVVETVVPNPPPEVLRKDASSQAAVRVGTAARTLALDVDRDEVRLLSQREHAGFGPRFLDVYDRQDGTYLHSLKLPTGATVARLRGDDLLVLESGRVRLFRLDRLAPDGGSTPTRQAEAAHR